MFSYHLAIYNRQDIKGKVSGLVGKTHTILNPSGTGEASANCAVLDFNDILTAYSCTILNQEKKCDWSINF